MCRMKVCFSKMFLVCVLALLPGLAVLGQVTDMPEHYPAHPASTGNVAKDDSIWVRLKNDWITNYPNEYRSVSGNPDDILPKKPVIVDQPASEVKVFKPSADMNSVSFYKMVDMDAVDVFSQHTPEQMAKYKVEAKQTLEKVALSIDMDNGKYFLMSKVNEGQGSEYNFKVVDEKMVLEGCKECIDSVYKIISQDDNTLVIQVKPQDLDQFFMFQITLKK